MLTAFSNNRLDDVKITGNGVLITDENAPLSKLNSAALEIGRELVKEGKRPIN